MISIQIIVIELIKKDVFLSKATYKINSEDIRSYSICTDNSSHCLYPYVLFVQV